MEIAILILVIAVIFITLVVCVRLAELTKLGCVMVQYRRYFDANGKELISVERRADGQLKEGSDFCPGVAEKLAATKDSLLQQPPPAADLMSNPERAYATPAVCQ